jgi:electron transport complex protein RnfG
MSNAPSAPAAHQPVAARRLVATLGVAGVIAGALLVVVYQATLPAITANKARRLELAIREVLREPARYDTLYVVDGELRREPRAGGDPSTAERVYLGYDSAGSPVGFAVPAGSPGFQDWIGLLFGYDARTNRMLGMRVLESKDTPGLGDKIERDTAFVGQFAGLATPLVGIKAGAESDTATVDMITGATISSRAVIKAINDALARLGPAMTAYRPPPPQVAGPAATESVP